ncbi:hypothetical protein LOK49_Contig25G00009 [Camellia lanceoleosa]|nr:hypothetical protein LOK49_Contig25G00009 [Camellia lanceoleosa]
MIELRNAGLEILAREVLGKEIKKPKRITMSRWDNELLYPKQAIQYMLEAVWISNLERVFFLFLRLLPNFYVYGVESGWGLSLLSDHIETVQTMDATLLLGLCQTWPYLTPITCRWNMMKSIPTNLLAWLEHFVGLCLKPELWWCFLTFKLLAVHVSQTIDHCEKWC